MHTQYIKTTTTTTTTTTTHSNLCLYRITQVITAIITMMLIMTAITIPPAAPAPIYTGNFLALDTIFAAIK